VRERAAAASTDAGVAEFLRYGWLSAAGIDLDAFRAQYVADEWVKWRDAKDLAATAVIVDRAARAGTGEPFAAFQAWNELSEHAARQPGRWAEREQLTRGPIDAWTATYYTADASASPLWAALATESLTFRSQWATVATGAAEQRTWWTVLVRYAQATAGQWL
jgi:hypothetical protein